MPLKWPLRRRNGGDKDRQKNDDDDSLQNNDQQLPQTLPANGSTTTTMVERFSDYSESDSDGGDNHQSSEIESTLVPGLLTSKSYSAPSTSSRRRQSEGSVSEPARARTSERPLSALDEMFSATTTTTMTTTASADGMQASADRLRPSLDELFCTTVEGQARLQASLRYGNTQQERPVSTAEHIRRQMRRNATHMVEMTSRPVVKLHKKVTRNRIRSTPSETPVYPRANGLPEMQMNGFSDMTFAAQAEVASGHLTSNGGGGNDNIVIMDLDDVDGY